MSLVDVEHVLVVPTEVFHGLGHFQGFHRDVDRYVTGLLRHEHFRFVPRPAAEADPSLKQLIPYVIFRYEDPDRGPCLFHYTRGSGQGEQRLHAKRSIGVGGHISAEDRTTATGELPDNLYDAAMRRELAEEVYLDGPHRAACVGLINDDQTEVGRVHLGIVHLFDLTGPHVRPREADLCDAGFAPVDALLADCDRFETWSQYCLRALFD
ncbi:MAG: phosphoesterase [Pirellulales bacterium]|nr:phosphoesterase [Pirellulales bacterium]